MNRNATIALLVFALLGVLNDAASAQTGSPGKVYDAALQEPSTDGETDLPAGSLLSKTADYSTAYQDPEPLVPGAGSSVGDPDIDARFRTMQAEIEALKVQQSTLSLAPGRARSSDLPPPDTTPEKPKYPLIKLTGFFQADTAFFNQDAANVASLGNIQDQTGFRRARLAAVGDVSEDVSYMLEMDFAFPGRPSFMDVWLDVHNVPVLGNIRVGQWRQPFGMDNLTSVRELTFLERPLSFAFTPFRQVGVGFYNYNEAKTVSWFGSVYRFPTDVWGDGFGDKGYGGSARLTNLVYEADDGCRLLHIGGEYTLTHPSSGTIQYRAQPEFGGAFTGASGNSFSVPFYVNTGVLSAPNSNLFNAEIAGVWGSFHFQSEATYAAVQQNGGPTVTFPTVYAQAAYILTGEVRPYNKNNAVLGRIKPNCPTGKGGIGAWEVATRFSYMDLNASNVSGGRINNSTIGLNWYLNNFTKFQFDYIHSSLNDNVVGHSDSNIAMVRAQLDF